MLMVVGIFMFIVTFCGCVGSLRENLCLLQTGRGKVTEMINKSIVHYRDDIDLQNLIDFGQKEFRCCGGEAFTDWSHNIYFNCSDKNPSRERCSVPFSCCIMTKDTVRFRLHLYSTLMCGQGMQELTYIRAGEHIYTDGCIDKLANWIHSNLFIIGGIALGLANTAAGRHASVSDFDQSDQRPDRAAELQRQAPLRPVELNQIRMFLNSTDCHAL
ncbi:Tetraspanin-33 [Oryzias melastigma]|uniref:Tetraspanin-33 n=1 Tax=Oryzias melastigma TaxID=30732 RepID=A0A834FGU6_ORYME|nr:Tetraspanin-33 [Oryzias melastigma]